MLLNRYVSSLILLPLAASLADAESLAAIEARMDLTAPSFKTVNAKIKKTSFTKVISDTTSEYGTILMKRAKANDTWVKIEFTGADERVAVFHDKKYESYLPKMKLVQEYNLAQYGSLVDQFLLLGFGTSGKALAEKYEIKVVKQEELAGLQTTRIELTPKSKEAREHLEKIEMWIPEGQSHPLQQKLHFKSGNYDLVTYSDLKLNGPLSDDMLKLKLPSGVKREFPQR